MHPAAVPELIMALKVMILQLEISVVVPTKSPTEYVPIIINEVANGESKDDIVLGKEAKKKRIEVGNIEENLMNIDLDEFKDLISMPIDFVSPEKFSDMIEKINLSLFFFAISSDEEKAAST
ncbi:hypothetical protein ACSBR1_004725 [Camellia fascicularis]